jgi:hypothetical protein
VLSILSQAKMAICRYSQENTGAGQGLSNISDIIALLSHRASS